MGDLERVDYQEFQKEVDYVVANQEFLRALYGNKYIGVIGVEVVDSDENEFGLVRRMVQDYPDKSSFLIDTIEGIVNFK